MNKQNLQLFLNPSGLKMLIFVRRLPTLTKQAFRDYWLNQHAPLALGAHEKGHAPPMLGYVQNHGIDVEQLSESRLVYDGLTEVWLDQLDDLDMSAQASDELVATNQRLIADEASFVDLPQCLVFAVKQQHCFVAKCDAAELVKLVVGIRRLDTVTETAFLSHWLDGEVLKTPLAASLGIIAYEQSAIVTSQLMDDFRAMREMRNDTYDGVLELWCDREKILQNPTAILDAVMAAIDASVSNKATCCVIYCEPHRVF
jgi:hypothetical protein